MTAIASPETRRQLAWLAAALATAAAIAVIFHLAGARAEARLGAFPQLARANIVVLIQDEISAAREGGGAPDEARLMGASQRIEQAVQVLAAETGYLILADQALLAGGEQLPDLTEELRVRIKESESKLP